MRSESLWRDISSNVGIFLVGILGQTFKGGLKSWLCFKVLTLENNVKELSTLNALDADRKQLGLKDFDIVE